MLKIEISTRDLDGAQVERAIERLIPSALRLQAAIDPAFSEYEYNDHFETRTATITGTVQVNDAIVRRDTQVYARITVDGVVRTHNGTIVHRVRDDGRVQDGAR